MFRKELVLIVLSVLFYCLPAAISHAQDANGVCRQPQAQPLNGAVVPPPAPRTVRRQTRAARTDTFGYGGLGETDARSGEGYGSGAGRGLRGRGVSGPTIRTFDSLAWIRDTIHSRHAQMVSCYTRALDRNTNLVGHVTVHFTILSDGHVAPTPTLWMEPSVDEPGFRACLVRAVGRWTFTPPQNSGVTSVNYPYNFSPEEDPPRSQRPGRT